MIELPESIKERIEELGAELERHTPGHVPYQKFMEAIAQELWPDINDAIGVLSKLERLYGQYERCGYCESKAGDGHILTCESRQLLNRICSKYKIVMGDK